MAGGYDLGNAYVQIMPSAKGIKGALEKELNGETSKAGKAGGESLVKTLVGTVTGAIAAAGIGKLLQSALSEGGKIQQSFGGLDTIYGDASGELKKYAAEAYKAGISTNEYAEQAVSFGASLKQSFGDDIVGAAKAADMAIMDMADNSAKMGTSLDSIQHAYQGFAKQNYTMLDNLKLGYGGTKKEMERLLADAEKLSGKKYDISSLGDVYEAVHVVQEELGIAGVAAAEAQTTFSGSFAAMRSAATNFLASMSLGENVGPALQGLMSATQTFLVGNFLPLVKNTLTSIPTIISTIITEGGPLIQQTLTSLMASMGTFLQAGSFQQGVSTVNGMISGMMAQAPAMIASGADTLTNFITGAGQTLPGVIDTASETINSFTDNILTGLPGILDAGTEAVNQLSTGMQGALPGIIEAAGNAIASFLQTLFNHLPEIMESGLQLIQALAQGLWANFQVLVQAAGDAIITIAGTILSNLPTILECGIELIGAMIAGMVTRAPHVIATILSLIADIGKAFISYDWPSLGRRIIEGIANGIKNAARLIIDAAKNAAKSAFEGAKNFLGINSPSRLFRDEIGAMMAEGMVVGFEGTDVAGRIASDLSGIQQAVPNELGPSYSYGGFTINVYQQPGESSEELVDMIEGRINQRIMSKRAVFA